MEISEVQAVQPVRLTQLQGPSSQVPSAQRLSSAAASPTATEPPAATRLEQHRARGCVPTAHEEPHTRDSSQITPVRADKGQTSGTCHSGLALRAALAARLPVRRAAPRALAPPPRASIAAGGSFEACAVRETGPDPAGCSRAGPGKAGPPGPRLAARPALPWRDPTRASPGPAQSGASPGTGCRGSAKGPQRRQKTSEPRRCPTKGCAGPAAVHRGVGARGGLGDTRGTHSRGRRDTPEFCPLPPFADRPSATNPGPRRKPRPRPMGRRAAGRSAAIGRRRERPAPSGGDGGLRACGSASCRPAAAGSHPRLSARGERCVAAGGARVRWGARMGRRASARDNSPCKPCSVCVGLLRNNCQPGVRCGSLQICHQFSSVLRESVKLLRVRCCLCGFLFMFLFLINVSTVFVRDRLFCIWTQIPSSFDEEQETPKLPKFPAAVRLLPRSAPQSAEHSQAETRSAASAELRGVLLRVSEGGAQTRC